MFNELVLNSKFTVSCWFEQIENEYNTVQLAYKEPGTRYVQWAGTMAVRLETGVPWMMCKQKDAPDTVVGLEQPRRC